MSIGFNSNNDQGLNNISGIANASTNIAGVIKIATDDDILAGINTTKAVSPKQLKNAIDRAIHGSVDDKHYKHIQDIPSNHWIVVHNLHKKPGVEVVDSNDSKIWADWSHIDDNSLEVFFEQELTGAVYCN